VTRGPRIGAGIAALWVLLALFTSLPLGTRAASTTPAFDELAAYVAERAEDPGDSTARERRAWTRLSERFGRPDAEGAVDEFGSFALVSRAVRRSLEGDRQLAVLLELALDEAGDSLARDGSGVVQVLVLVDPGRNLERLQRRSGRAAALRLRFLVARAGGARAIGLGRRAAKAYRACRRRAERIVERQDRRDPAWSVVFHGLPGALLGVWADDDPVLPSVYAVGADDLDVGPQFVRLGGDGWVRIAVPVPGDLWWVAGVAGEGKRTDAVFACGSEGAVVRYDPATGAVDDVSVPWVSHTLFGVWGASRNDVWIVGGGPAPAGGSEPVLAHFDGTTWTAVVVPSQATQRVLFKVWGNAADDIFACGSGGVLLHYDGAEWTAVPTGTVATLLTVHGRKRD
jgi:hypothetical protein